MFWDLFKTKKQKTMEVLLSVTSVICGLIDMIKYFGKIDKMQLLDDEYMRQYLIGAYTYAAIKLGYKLSDKEVSYTVLKGYMLILEGKFELSQADATETVTRIMANANENPTLPDAVGDGVSDAKGAFNNTGTINLVTHFIAEMDVPSPQIVQQMDDFQKYRLQETDKFVKRMNANMGKKD